MFDWVETSILAGGSEIALHWTISDSRKLGMWHRNRVIQIRRGTDLPNLFYVGTEHNVADVGTRADKITLDDVGPESSYEVGDPWMKLDLVEAVKQGYLKCSEDLKSVPVEKEVEFKKGFLFERNQKS